MILPFPSIRTQLLILSLVMLIIPWMGLQMIRDIETMLREQHVQYAHQSMSSIIRDISIHNRYIDLHNQSITNSNPESAIILSKTDAPIVVDGYRDDWPDERFRQSFFAKNKQDSANLDFQVDISATHYARSLYVLVDIMDDRLLQTTSSELQPRKGDHLIMTLTDQHGQTGHYVLTSNAPGWLDVISSESGSRNDSGITAELQPHASGYTVEILMPPHMDVKYLGIQAFDYDKASDSPAMAGNITTDSSVGGLVLSTSDAIRYTLSRLKLDGQRIWVLDTAGYILADTGPPIIDGTISKQSTWMDRLIRILILADTSTALDMSPFRMQQDFVMKALDGHRAHQFYQTRDGEGFLSTAAPVLIDGKLSGAVVLDHSTGSISGIRYRALTKTILISLSGIIVVSLLLLAYASLLIRRIRNLNRQMDQAIGKEGKLTGDIPASIIGDEIGDLNRGISDMTEQVRAYQDYLETMSSKLSHELRTPMTVVASSLESLKHDNPQLEDNRLLERAEEGLGRLKLILSSLSEASRLEQSLVSIEKQSFDLASVVFGCVEGYTSAYPDLEIGYHCDKDDINLSGSPELVAQLLDKLVSNARDFHEPGSTINVEIHTEGAEVSLCVRNQGETIPARQLKTLFDSMVSNRSRKDNVPHLGLGLYIVRLIAEYHEAHVSVESADNSTCFCVVFTTS